MNIFIAFAWLLLALLAVQIIATLYTLVAVAYVIIIRISAQFIDWCLG